MVNQQHSRRAAEPEPNLDAAFAAVATPLRRAMLDRLRGGPMSPGELWAGSGVSKPAISKNLAVLEEAGLIERTREGRSQRVELRGRGLRPAAGWLASYRQFWDPRLDAMVEQIEAEHAEADRAGTSRRDPSDDH